MEIPEPIVSVIISTYNWSSALRYSIGSVLWQTLANFELLVVGDGCTDDSAEVVASFGDPRIRWHNLPENSGNQPAPNNAGIAMARGRYVAYLGHDDIWLPDHLKCLVSALEKSAGDVSYGWIELIGPDPVQVRVICGITASGEYELGASLVPTCFMHRRAMIDEIGPWKDHRTINAPPDQDLIERAFHAGKKFVPVKRLTALKFPATWRPDSYLKKPVHQQADYFRRIQANPDFVDGELHDIVEFLIRKNPAAIASNSAAVNSRAGMLIENARRLRGLDARPLPSVPPPRRFPLLPGRIEMGGPEAGQYLWHGWSGREEGFRWTDGPEAHFVFGLQTVASLQMQIECAPLIVPKKLDAQRVVISCNGHEIARWNLTDWEMKTYTVRVDSRFLEGHNVVSFELPDATAPLRIVEGNTDFRHLALRVASIELQPEKPAL